MAGQVIIQGLDHDPDLFQRPGVVDDVIGLLDLISPLVRMAVGS